MRRATIKEFELLGENLSSYCGVFTYRLQNLCVKAEEVSLLPIEVLVEGEVQKLEKCTTIGKKDDYSFMIIPHYDEDMAALGFGITRVHPEFKQDIQSMKVNSVDETGNPKEVDVRYILVTMPEVDDNRYDVLKDGVKVCYEECKTQMQVCNSKADVRFAQLTVVEADEDIEKLKKAREKLNEQWNGKRDQLYNDKLKEIEDAHNKWLAARDEQERKRKEYEASHSQNAALSMRLGSDD
jgi:hypothetical protein